jgi:hypothetical protein
MKCDERQLDPGTCRQDRLNEHRARIKDGQSSVVISAQRAQMHGVHVPHEHRGLDDQRRRAHGATEGDNMTKHAIALSLATLAVLVAPPAIADHSSTTTSKQLNWIPLDAKAGAKGPQISVVFGDLKTKAPIGFVLKTPPGFRPGPHTHTSDDYAVVISGRMHNFQGKDEGPALAAGERWHQTGDETHDNYCEPGAECLVFVYMPNGFDFKPPTPH